ncbi:MAG: phosphate permease [Bacteroidales bacterium]|nr:MAG: phosphate permease [Bacteroidales bacterium]
METYYLIAVVILILLAMSDLVVGVANDAVNFLNSSIGSKVAPRHWILLVASAGVLVGSFFSSGMMEVARKGVFYPQNFYMSEIMVIFLAVMLTDVIVLDFFNTFGLPTSTTVSLVFELLGSAVAVSIFKIMGNDESLSNLGNYINSGKALAIISGILISVVVAFVVGTVVQYFARFLFTFNYKKSINYVGSIWGGFALTAITYFIVMKGVQGASIINESVLNYINEHTVLILFYSFLVWAVIFQILISVFKLNILRFVVLMGTFALALSFAGNDLVNFIGVSLAGLKSYQIHLANPGVAPDQLLMTDLAGPVTTNFIYLFIAGLIMVITLWTSRKARTVTETEVGLSRQDAGVERFGSTQFSRTLVRAMRGLSNNTGGIMPKFIKKFLESRFDTSKAPKYKNPNDAPAFDLIRASVNLVVSSILISSATSLKLPLSTTYVTFMVAMGTSLSDKAWGRESAVYRITGVLTVISGWFFTAFVTFTMAFIMAAALYYGKTPALIILVAIAVGLLIKSHLLHKKKVEAAKVDEEILATDDSVVKKCTKEVTKSLKDVLKTFTKTVEGLTNEDRKTLKQVNKDVEELNAEAKKLKYNVYTVLKKLEADSIETGHYYIQVIDYLREIAHSLTFVVSPSLQHIDNQHKGLTKAQASELKEISENISVFFDDIMKMIKENDYTGVPDAIKKQQDILEIVNDARKKQVKRIKQSETGTRNSVLYLGLLNEIKNIMLHTVNLMKAQRDFILNNID